MAGLLPPDVRAIIRELLRRVDLLERRLANLAKRKVVIDVPFTMPGIVALDTSPPYYFQEPGAAVFEVVMSLGTAGIGTTTVVVYRNGNQIGTVSLAAGETVDVVKMTSDFTGNQDRLQVATTAIGSGAADLDVQVRGKMSY